jgi:hypothetical protein
MMSKLSLKMLRIFGKISVTLGCLFFLFSTILPFSHTVRFGDSQIPEYKPYYSTYYWSFRALQESRNLFGGYGTSRPIEYWFYEPGFYDYVPGPLLSRVLVVIFVAQLLTLVSGIASVFFNRRILALAPLALCSLVTVLMIYTSIVLPQSRFAVDSYLLGYLFTYPAIMLFLFSFILNIADKKRSITYTPTHT